MSEEQQAKKMSIEEVVPRLIEIIDQGLTFGMGFPTPGQLCVEAAVCLALDMEHGDTPRCVHGWLIRGMIALNDFGWPSNEVRSNVLRRLAILQLGTNSHRIDTPLKGLELEDQKILFWEFSFSDFSKKLVIHLAKGRVADMVDEYIRCTERNPRGGNPTDPRWMTIVDTLRNVKSHYEAGSAVATAGYMITREIESRHGSEGVGAFFVGLYRVFSRVASMDFLRDVVDQFSKVEPSKNLLHLIHAMENVLIEMEVPGAKFMDLVPPTPNPEP